MSEQTEQEFLNAVVNGLDGWIPLRTYLRLFPEESRIAVNSRIKRKHWIAGTHYSTPTGGRMWVNLRAIGQWAAQHGGGD